MNIFAKRFNSPLTLSIAFILLLPISYIIYFAFVNEYATILMKVSSSLLAWMFDMSIVSNSYIENIKFISNSFMQNSQTHEVARVEILLSKNYIDKLLTTITNTTMVLSIIFLFSKNIKFFLMAFAIMFFVHLTSIIFIIMNFMFFTSQESIISIIYFKSFGINQILIDIVHFVGLISFYYVKYFTPMLMAYWLYESNKCSFIAESSQCVDIKGRVLSYLHLIEKG